MDSHPGPQWRDMHLLPVMRRLGVAVASAGLLSALAGCSSVKSPEDVATDVVTAFNDGDLEALDGMLDKPVPADQRAAVEEAMRECSADAGGIGLREPISVAQRRVTVPVTCDGKKQVWLFTLIQADAGQPEPKEPFRATATDLPGTQSTNRKMVPDDPAAVRDLPLAW